MKKSNVLQLIDSLNIGGAETLAVNIANALVNNNHTSHLCTTRKEGDLKTKINSEVGYLFLNKKKTLDVSALKKISKYIKVNKIDLIHAHSTSCFTAFLIKLLKPKLKVVWHIHSGKYVNSGFFRKTIFKFCSIFFDSIITVNQELALWFGNEITNQEKVFHLNNFPLLNDSKNETTLKGTEDKRILCLASFREEKDHLNLLKAFSKIALQREDWTLHLVGNYNPESKYFISVKNYISHKNLENRIFIYGQKSDIKNILSQSTIGVLSSKSEGLPISLLEYGLAKLPVLVTDVGQCKEVCNSKYGIVEKENDKEFAERLIKIIDNDSIKEKIAELIHNNVINNYSQESFMKKLETIYLR